MHLFVYGTLMEEEIGRRMGLGRYERIPAVLRGYSRKRVKNEVYPGLVEDEGNEVAGVVFLDVTKQDVGRLDRFEGEEYDRISVTVFSRDRSLICETYLFKREYRRRLMDEAWNMDTFLEEGKGRFIEDYKGWNEAR